MCRLARDPSLRLKNGSVQDDAVPGARIQPKFKLRPYPQSAQRSKLVGSGDLLEMMHQMRKVIRRNETECYRFP